MKGNFFDLAHFHKVPSSKSHWQNYGCDNTYFFRLSHYGFSFEPILVLSQPKFLLMTRNPVLDAFKVGTIINRIGFKLFNELL